jgi:hypothetical protein
MAFHRQYTVAQMGLRFVVTTSVVFNVFERLKSLLQTPAYFCLIAVAWKRRLGVSTTGANACANSLAHPLAPAHPDTRVPAHQHTYAAYSAGRVCSIDWADYRARTKRRPEFVFSPNLAYNTRHL